MRFLFIAFLALAFAAPSLAQQQLAVVSFNIKFIGSYTEKRHADLAAMLAAYDIVVVQELVFQASPRDPPFDQNWRVVEFFNAMISHGFSYVLSTDRTGGIGTGLTAREWFVVFYDPTSVSIAADLPNGFIGDPLVANPDFDRVPFAVGLRSADTDFVLISVHLHAAASGSDRREHELQSILDWIDRQPGRERDYLILGDFNFQSCREYQRIRPAGYRSLNEGCAPTNLPTRTPRPYDHVLFTDATLPEFGLVPDPRLSVVDLVTVMRALWPGSDDTFPDGSGIDEERLFEQLFSDHLPVMFLLSVGQDDD